MNDDIIIKEEIKNDDHGANSNGADRNTSKEALPRLIKYLIGVRTIRETSRDTGVAASYISGMLNGKYTPSASILKKISSPEANPQNGITLEELMIAAGYQNQTSKTREPSYLEYYPYWDQSYYSNKYMQMKTEEIRVRASEFEALAIDVIKKALDDKGIRFSNLIDFYDLRMNMPSMAVSVSKEPIFEWWFECFITDKDKNPEMVGNMLIRRIVGDLILKEPKRERKYSAVISSTDVFNEIIKYQEKLAYRGDLSIILIDEEGFNVVKEVYLTHYDEYDTSTEFYLI